MRLTWSSDEHPGISRARCGRGFTYRDARGRPLSAADRARVAHLAIPPAWQRVWICPSARGHLQATGRDARGRKQYLYHAAWREARDAGKFERLAAFGRALPAIRRRIARDVRLPGLPREKVLAAVVRLLDETLARVGNESYAKENGSYGLTTLRNRHVTIMGGAVRFAFRGKSAVAHDIAVEDARLARVVRRCLDLPGQRLFQYVGDDGRPRRVDSGAVNAYLRDISGLDISAKDFRTWAGSVAAHAALAGLGEVPAAKTARLRAVSAVVKAVAQSLRNTPAVCRKSYIHPGIVAAFCGAGLAPARPVRVRGLAADERALLAFLERR